MLDRLLRALAVAILLAGCRAEAGPRADAGSAPAPIASTRASSFKGARTEALVTAPELRRRVDALAAETRIESAAVGEAGTPSASFARFEAVRGIASEADLAALLRHESPVVRGYAGRYVAVHAGAIVPKLEPLLADATEVATMEGCLINPNDSVHGVVESALCYSNLPEARALIAELAKGATPQKLFATGCYARRDPRAAAELSLAELRRRPPNAIGYVNVLWDAPLEEACPDIIALKDASDADARRLVARALGVCTSDASLLAIDELARDADPLVARTANVAAALHARQTAAGRERILAGDRILSLASIELELRLRRKDVTSVLPIVETMSIAHPREMNNAMTGLYGHQDEPAVIAMLRRIAASVAPSLDGAPYVRDYAIRVLGALHSQSDVAELRRSLGSKSVSELIDAATALGEMHDGASRGALLRLISDPNLAVATAAKTALASL